MIPMLSGCLTRQHGANRLEIAFAKLYGNMQLFQVLLQRLSAEVDLAGRKEVTHVTFQFRG